MSRLCLLRVQREDGFTLVEVLVAAAILVLGALAVLMTFAAAIHNVQRGKATQVALSVAQKEMEKLRTLPYASLAFPGTYPAASGDSNSPLKRVSGSSFNLARSGTSNFRPMVTASGGKIPVAPANFSSGGSSGKVYIFVVSMNDKPCEETTGKACTYKRAVIAVQLNAKPGESYVPRYVELQSDFANPAP